MKNHLKKTLINLAVGELVAVIVFWINFFIFKKYITDTISIIPVIFTLSLLSFILIQGSIFWLILLKRISNKNFAKTSLGKIYNHLRKLDIILLYLSILTLIVNHQTFTTTIISLSIWIFAIIEYINYYKVRLSYKQNVLINYILHGKIRKSRIAREIESYKKQYNTLDNSF